MNKETTGRALTCANELTLKAIESGAIHVQVTSPDDALAYVKTVVALYDAFLDEFSKRNPDLFKGLC